MGRKKEYKPRHAKNQSASRTRVRFKMAQPGSVVPAAALSALALALLCCHVWLPAPGASVSPLVSGERWCEQERPESSQLLAHVWAQRRACSSEPPSSLEPFSAELEGLYATAPGVKRASLSPTYWAHDLLASPLPHERLSWLLSLQSPSSGGFSQRLGMVPTLTATRHALELLGPHLESPSLPPTALRNASSFILSCARPDGSFGDTPLSSASLALDSSVAACLALASPPLRTLSYLRYHLEHANASFAAPESLALLPQLPSLGPSLALRSLLTALGAALLFVGAPWAYFHAQLPEPSSMTYAAAHALPLLLGLVALLSPLPWLAVVPYAALAAVLLWRFYSLWRSITWDDLENAILLGLASSALYSGLLVGLQYVLKDAARLTNPGMLYLGLLYSLLPALVVHYPVATLLDFRRVDIHRASAYLAFVATCVTQGVWAYTRSYYDEILPSLLMQGQLGVALFTLPATLLLSFEAGAMLALSMR